MLAFFFSYSRRRHTSCALVTGVQTCALPIWSPDTPSGTLFSLKTAAAIFWQATAVSGVFSEGFHIQTSPHTQAIIAFHDQTATGKLKAEMMPTSPRGCHCSYMRCR